MHIKYIPYKILAYYDIQRSIFSEFNFFLTDILLAVLYLKQTWLT